MAEALFFENLPRRDLRFLTISKNTRQLSPSRLLLSARDLSFYSLSRSSNAFIHIYIFFFLENI